MELFICRLLLASLALGAGLAPATGLVLLLTQRASPALRYRLLTGLLALFAAGMAAIAVYIAPQGYPAGGTLVHPSAWRGSLPVPAYAPLSMQRMEGLLGTYAPWIAGCWLLMAGVKSIRLAAGLRFVHRMRTRRVVDAGAQWQARVRELAQQLGVTRPVRIMQSALAQAPLVTGHLKPLILMPLGMMAQLPAAEVEAILCHELAHIRRSDFLVNLLQALLEVFFFFNPAVLWLNRLIREEREHCCDDLALGVGGGVQDYVRALIYSQQASVRPAYALSFAGPGNQLLGRVSRILQQRRRRLRASFPAVAVPVLLSAALLLALAGQKSGSHRTITTRTRVENAQGITRTEQTVREELPALDARKYCKPGPGQAPPAYPPAGAAAALQQDDTVPAGYVRTADAYEPFTDQDGRDLRNELAADGIIGADQVAQVSYLLNNEELIVNQVRQPGPVHRKYAAKYVRYAGRCIVYNYEHTGYPGAN